MKGGFDHDLAARVLVDAIALGDRTAADRHKVSEKTVGRYRARLRTDAVLADLVRDKARKSEVVWHVSRERFLRAAFAKLEQLAEAATVDHLEPLVEAVKAAGELELLAEHLRGVRPNPPEQGEAHREDAPRPSTTGRPKA